MRCGACPLIFFFLLSLVVAVCFLFFSAWSLACGRVACAGVSRDVCVHALFDRRGAHFPPVLPLTLQYLTPHGSPLMGCGAVRAGADPPTGVRAGRAGSRGCMRSLEGGLSTFPPANFTPEHPCGVGWLSGRAGRRAVTRVRQNGRLHGRAAGQPPPTPGAPPTAQRLGGPRQRKSDCTSGERGKWGKGSEGGESKGATGQASEGQRPLCQVPPPLRPLAAAAVSPLQSLPGRRRTAAPCWPPPPPPAAPPPARGRRGGR